MSCVKFSHTVQFPEFNFFWAHRDEMSVENHVEVNLSLVETQYWIRCIEKIDRIQMVSSGPWLIVFH